VVQRSEHIAKWLSNWPVWVVLITLGVGLSWAWNLRTLEQHALSIALERGRYTFKIIEATRLWVAKHGVAYVLRSDMPPSNPYLEIPEKDITTPSGKPLTAVNPAYMTRQLTDILRENHALHVHLTSLKPLNPGNRADAWESKALSRFPQGVKETVELVEGENSSMVRYMAPLFVKKACMKCHAKQGYEVGDIRGGISVSFDFAPFLASTAGQGRNIHGIHLAAWLVLSLFSIITSLFIRRHESAIERARDDAERLVKERTQSLREEVQIRRSTENKLQLLLNATEEGIFGVDRHGCVSFMNPSGLSMLGYASPTQIVGHKVTDVFPRKHADGRPIAPDECQIETAWQKGLSGHSEDEFFYGKTGKQLPIEYHVHPLFSEGSVVGAVVNFSDISLRKAFQESLWLQANFDNLTGIPNRALLIDRLTNAIEQSRRAKLKLALLYIDLNGFKPINDRYGHEAGDEVLRTIAKRLVESNRVSDTVARMGGDEFVVLLNQVSSLKNARSVADKIKSRVSRPIEIESNEVSVGVAIGISMFPDDADNLEALLARADQAMYQEKDKG
jgi:diguanylate cyclase (GGDEF)-like protein/PAS domain S-box-containing protein